MKKGDARSSRGEKGGMPLAFPQGYKIKRGQVSTRIRDEIGGKDETKGEVFFGGEMGAGRLVEYERAGKDR